MWPSGGPPRRRADWRNFRPGQVLRFHRAVKGIERNATVEVVRADARGVVVQGGDGGERLRDHETGPIV